MLRVEKNQEIQSKDLALTANESVRVPRKIQLSGRQRARRPEDADKTMKQNQIKAAVAG
jgi:hypothetical protein